MQQDSDTVEAGIPDTRDEPQRRRRPYDGVSQEVFGAVRQRVEEVQEADRNPRYAEKTSFGTRAGKIYDEHFIYSSSFLLFSPYGLDKE